MLNGVSGASVGLGGGMYFTGYSEPASVNVAFNGASNRLQGMQPMPSHALCGDACIRVTSKMQKSRALWVHNKPDDAKHWGCNGWSLFVRELDYVDYNDVWVLPFAHSAFYGVVKRFWNLLLGKMTSARPEYVITGAMRRVMMGRGAHMVMTNDLNRPYRDIVQKRGNWTMEDWMRWTECYSVYVLHKHDGVDVMPKVTKDGQIYDLGAMWGSLRTSLLHYMHYDPEDFSDEACDKAIRGLRAFARDAEAVFGHCMCTYNLHVLCCRLREQERARGHVSFSYEFWVERGIQLVKSDVKFRTTQCPELLFVSSYLGGLTLAQLKHVQPRTFLSFDELVPSYRMANRTLDARSGTVYVDEEDDEGTQLLGGGFVASDDQRDLIEQALRKAEGSDGLATRLQIPFDAEGHLGCDMYVFGRALKRRDEIFLSRAYTLPTTRESFYLKVKYDISRADQASPPKNLPETHKGVGVWIAEVAFFAQLVERTQGLKRRVAVCVLHKAEVVVPNALYVVANFSPRTPSAAELRDEVLLPVFAVDINAVDTKVIRCKVSSAPTVDGSKSCYFLAYSTSSQMPTNDGVVVLT